MNMLNGIQNFLQFFNDNWTSILVIIGLSIAIFKKMKNYLGKSDEEKIAIAKAQIHEMILKLISDAEADYESWNKAGNVKRAQVISEIFSKYPILAKVVDQNELMQWLDDEIENALSTLQTILEQQ